MLAAPLVVMSAIWMLLSPYANRGLDQRRLVDPMTLVTYLYLALFTLAVILIAVSFVYLSAKRARARGLFTSFGALAPLAALIAGAAHWLYPRAADVIPLAIVRGLDVIVVILAIACVVELGVKDSRKGST